MTGTEKRLFELVQEVKSKLEKEGIGIFEWDNSDIEILYDCAKYVLANIKLQSDINRKLILKELEREDK